MLCHHCQTRLIPAGHRRYCDDCSRTASARWKREHRRAWNASWRAEGRQGPPPWLDGWPSADARRAYHRAYMSRWRARRQS